jgi:hypothetical protein
MRAAAAAQPDKPNLAVHEPPFGFRPSGTTDPAVQQRGTANLGTLHYFDWPD